MVRFLSSVLALLKRRAAGINNGENGSRPQPAERRVWGRTVKLRDDKY